MPFKKGIVSNPVGGKPKFVQTDPKSFVRELLMKSEKEIKKIYESLPPEEKLQAFIAMLPYCDQNNH